MQLYMKTKIVYPTSYPTLLKTMKDQEGKSLLSMTLKTMVMKWGVMRSTLLTRNP